MLNDSEIMAQVLAAFHEEQAEHRQAIGELLLDLERHPGHSKRQALLDQLFREAHSLKGGARAAGQPEVEQVAHLLEDLFSAVRQGRLELTPDTCDPIYAALDVVGVLMSQVTAGQLADLHPHEALLTTLTHIRDTNIAPPALVHQPEHRDSHHNGDSNHAERRDLPSADAPKQNGGSEADTGRSNGQAGSRVSVAHQGNGSYKKETNGSAPTTGGAAAFSLEENATVRLSTTTLDQLMNETGELMTCTVRARQRARDIRALADLPASWRRTWRQTHPAIARLRSRTSSFKPVVHYLADRSDIDSRTNHTLGGGAPARSAASADVDGDTTLLLDALAQADALIGELERRLAGHAGQISEDTTRLGVITDRLHDQVRRTRMLPLAGLFSPLRLQMRDMARAAGKRAALDLDDGGAEADRQVLDRLREVLLHLLRNAIDHGIEPAESRVAAGKAAEGRIAIRATVDGDHLTLTVADDGAGLNFDTIRQRARAGGLLAEAELARASEDELADLIFMPGFSTRQTVSALSGRGVGLDIVRAQVERMHGRISVQSVAGAGCTFTVTAPLSLTSSRYLLLRVDVTTYALPLDAVQRIVPVAPQDIQSLEDRATLVVDDRPLPLVHLADILGMEHRSPIGASRQASWASRRMLGLLLGSGDRQAACLVDEVVDEQELMVHRLPAPLQQVHLIAGATILADGDVVPILDAVDLLRSALGTRPTFSVQAESSSERLRTLLVVDDSITTRTLEKNILEAAGYRVRLATDGAEALQALGELADGEGCDLLLSDVDMPRLNGFDLTTTVRADSRFQHLPIVLVTSLDTPVDRERGIAAGADAYIVKRTFDQQVLIDTIEQLI
jgi:two-component system chemotaxis sensor kinase CheA